MADIEENEKPESTNLEETESTDPELTASTNLEETTSTDHEETASTNPERTASPDPEGTDSAIHEESVSTVPEGTESTNHERTICLDTSQDSSVQILDESLMDKRNEESSLSVQTSGLDDMIIIDSQGENNESVGADEQNEDSTQSLQTANFDDMIVIDSQGEDVECSTPNKKESNESLQAKTADVIMLDTTDSSSQGVETDVAKDSSPQKEVQGIYPLNPFADDDDDTADNTKESIIPIEPSPRKEVHGIFPANPFAEDEDSTSKDNNNKGRSISFGVCMDGLLIDLEGDSGQNEEEEKVAPYPVHEIPKYNNIVAGVLSDIEYSMETGKKIHDAKKPKMTCFNCLGNHSVPECKEPLDYRRIAENRKMQRANKISSVRYHEDVDNKYGQYQPGKISDTLRQALGLRYGELPIHIYRMRCLGYPPGWLKEAEVPQGEMKLFDGAGQSVNHPDREEGETDEKFFKYNPDKLISFPGFNVPVPKNYRDEWQDLNFPPMQHIHKKSEFRHFMNLNKVGSYRKRKLKDDSLPSSIPTTDSPDMDLDETAGNSSADIEFNPPLPDEPMPPLPPDDTSSSSPKHKPPSEDGELEEDSQSSMDYLEAKRKALLEQLDQSGQTTSSESNIEDAPVEKGNPRQSPFSKLKDGADREKRLRDSSAVKESPKSPSNLSENDNDTEESSSQNNDDSENSKSGFSTLGVKRLKKHHRSQSKSIKLGAAIPASITPFSRLPDADKWMVDVTDHINFENLPDALGTWDKMKGLVQRVRKTMVRLHPEDED